MANTMDKVLKIALDEVGYLEKKSNKDLYDKTKNAGFNNFTKYGKEMHDLYPTVMDYPAYWCDCFVDWCFYKAYGDKQARKILCGDFNDYTPSSAQHYKNKKRWFATPNVGDQIFFTNGTRICHTGIVYKVTKTYVYVVEGNTSSGNGVVANGGGVVKKAYPITYKKIAGYGRPLYDEEEKTTDNQTNEQTKKSNKPKNIPSPTLKKGNKGKQVSYLQECLNFVLEENLKVDGEFGKNTFTVLKKFQKKYGLKVDGVYGDKSYSKLTTLL